MAEQQPKRFHVHSGETYEIESESLEAHVAICSERFLAVQQHLQDCEVRLTDKIDNNSSQIIRLEKVFFWGIGAIFVNLFGFWQNRRSDLGQKRTKR